MRGYCLVNAWYNTDIKGNTKFMNIIKNYSHIFAYTAFMLAVVAFTYPSISLGLGNIQEVPKKDTALVSKTVTLGTTDQRILATSTAKYPRSKFQVVNNGSYKACLQMDGDKAAATTTGAFCLNANGGSYTSDDVILYTGAVHAIAEGGTTSLSVIEY